MQPVTGYFALTVAELRALLFELDNQEMTIRELRASLFGLDLQKEAALSGIDRVNKQAQNAPVVVNAEA